MEINNSLIKHYLKNVMFINGKEALLRIERADWI